MPRISQRTLDELKGKDLIDAVKKYVSDLKKNGANWVGTSPFTNEKTPSFTVSPSKGLWKCFSTDAFGFDIIKLYMEINTGVDFYEAIKELCFDFGIEIQYEEISPEREAQEKKEREEQKQLNELMEFALMHFLSNDVPEKFIKTRSFKKSTLEHFQIGYADDGWESFSKKALDAGYDENLLISSGLSKKREKGGLYDFFRDRVVFPIFNTRNQVVAFTGRAMKPDEKTPKYWHIAGAKMSNLMFGLHQAKSHLKEKKIYFVEGPTDVLRCFEKGIKNVVCSSGSSLTEMQIKILQRLDINTICFIPDNDLKKLESSGKNPGINALHRNCKLALSKGINDLQVLIPEKWKKGKEQLVQLIEDFDPDNFLLKLRTPDEVTNWRLKEQDYITGYLQAECERIGLQGTTHQVEQHKRMAEIINSIADDQFRIAYHDAVSNEGGFWKLFKKSHKVKERTHSVDLEVLNELSEEQKGDYFTYGFQEKNNCYVFSKGNEATNFIIEVLFYVYSNDDAKFVCLFHHANGRKRVAPIVARDFITLNALRGALVNIGPNWQFTGNQQNLEKIKVKIFEGVKEASEPMYMGYDPVQNFYTWANGIYYQGRFFQANKYGIVTLKKSIKSVDEFLKLQSDDQIEIGQHHYIIKNDVKKLVDKIGTDDLIDLISDREVYKMEYKFLPFATSLRMATDGDDDYEYERKFRFYHESEELDFNVWADQLVQVYGDNGKVMICFFIMALFRDIIYKANNNWMPMLNHFGMPGSGKSKAAESLAYMFGDIIEDGINLESGSTETGIRRYLASVSNAIIWLNEFKNTIQEGKRGMLKGIADGSGKVTGRKTSGNQLKTYKPKSTAIVCGQDIPTIDPALIDRSFFSDFDKANRNKEAYDLLKAWEKAGRGTHVTCQLLGYRETLKDYKKTEPQITKMIYEYAEKTKVKVDDRPVLNATSLLTPIYLLMQEGSLTFPFDFETILAVVVSRLEMQVDIKSAEDDVEKFFNVLSYCVDNGTVREGEHFEIKRQKGQTYLYLRLRQVMPHYKDFARRMDTIALQESTLKSYLEKHACYKEFDSRNVRFEHLANPTSAFVLDYEVLLNQGIELKTKSAIETGPGKSNLDFLTGMLNASKQGHRFTFEELCAILTKHERSIKQDNSLNIIKEQLDGYLINYLQDDKNKWRCKEDSVGITLMTKLDFE